MVVFLIICFSGTMDVSAASDVDYWPTNGWKVTSPEEQGVSTGALADMMEFIRERHLKVDSITIVRNGYLVMDTCFYPFPENTKHHLRSCSKSVISALVGIAIEKGYIKYADQPVLSFFPDRTVANLDENKKKITLRHLLTMTSGLDCRDGNQDRWIGMYQMLGSKDWTQWVLDRPMKEAPGLHFEYSNCVTYLISAILQEATGMRSLDFARQHLFAPLGIDDASWDTNPQGVDFGYSRLWLKPHDMAKIGWLYLNNGRWDGLQVVPAAWVESSVQGQVEAQPTFSRYGYQWWVGDGFYAAVGASAQFIFVAPDENLVAVITGATPMGQPFSMVRDLLKNFILPSVVSNSPLPPNLGETERLQKIAVAINTPPEETPAAPLPNTALAISGHTYHFETNRLGLKSLSLTFSPGSGEAWMKLVIKDQAQEMAIGLKNRFRISESGGRLFAGKGSWVEDDVFSYDYKYVGDAYWGDCRLEFKGGHIKFYGFDRSSHLTYEALGKQSDTGE